MKNNTNNKQQTPRTPTTWNIIISTLQYPIQIAKILYFNHNYNASVTQGTPTTTHTLAHMIMWPRVLAIVSCSTDKTVCGLYG